MENAQIYRVYDGNDLVAKLISYSEQEAITYATDRLQICPCTLRVLFHPGDQRALRESAA